MLIRVISIQVNPAALLAGIFLFNVSGHNAAVGQGQVAQGDVCVSFSPSSLLVASVKAGFRVRSENIEIPVTFSDSNRARAFLEQGQKHTGVCWVRSIEDDLKNGNDTYFVWQASLPQFNTPIVPLLPNPRPAPSPHWLGETCQVHSGYQYGQDKPFGHAQLRDGDSTLLTFDSKDEAQRAYRDLTGGSQMPELCVISITSRAHPVIAYKID